MKNIHILAILFIAVLAFAAVGASAQYYNYNYNYNSNYNSNCTYHAYRLCVGNNIYWYDSCGNQQDLYYSCYGGQTCQYGQCVAYVQPVQPVQPVPVYNNYVAHYKTACYSGSLYWYDSLGVASGLYKNCSDKNTCTLDSCSGNKCLNTLKCDGTTCAAGTADYNTYCAASQPAAAINAVLSTTFFVKQDASSNQWQKAGQANSNSTVYFMISLANNNDDPINNISVMANIPSEIASLGNLKLDGTQISGDIVSGVDIGSVGAKSSKTITFEGKTQTISANSTKQAIATATVLGATSSDSVSINFVPGQVEGASVSTAPATSGFGAFLGRWWAWILLAIVLIIIFVVVFRRLSSET